jgi:pimeloyl-ACP methyl ester carboxylesterase
MRRVKRGYDWGERSERWAGIVSDVVDVDGVRAHYLRSDASSVSTSNAITHVLVHPLGAGSWSWMDVIRPLSTHGPVIALDLPGAGRSRPRNASDARAEAGARFVADFCVALGLERVILHGHSMGALVGALVAAEQPERVTSLVLTSPPLPGQPDPPRFPPVWRAALWLAPRLGRIPMQAGIRWKTNGWRPRLLAEVPHISPELLSLIAQEIERYRVTWRIDGALRAAASAVAALTVDEARVRAELDRISAPTLVMWGENDRVLPHAVAEQLAQVHPTWDFRYLEGIGHLLPWEAPGTYVELVTAWLTSTNARTPFAAGL